MYEVWQLKDGVAGLFGNLHDDEKAALQEQGLKCVHTIEADDPVKAQEEFIDWCHQQQPDARVERCRFFDPEN